MQAWEASIDRQLVARLVRALVRPGVIGMALVRRILAGVAAMTERLPLLARFGGRRELVATSRIVHARWAHPAPDEPAIAPSIARPIVHAAPSERRPVPAVSREMPAPATAEPLAPLARSVERTPALEPPATIPLEPAGVARPSRSTSASPAIAAAHASEGAATTSEPRLSAVQASSRELVRSAGPAVPRSRVGAPLPARPRIDPSIEGQGPGPERPLTGRSIELPAGEVRARGAIARPMIRVKARATAAGQPALIADGDVPAGTPVVAAMAPRARSLVERRSVPIVPARSGDRARAIELPLAHPRASAPAPSAALPIAPTPRSPAAPPAVTDATAPPPPPKIDLHKLAEQVQHILIRQAAHTRARQGLPR